MVEVRSNAIKGTSNLSNMIKKIRNCLSKFSTLLRAAEWHRPEEIVAQFGCSGSNDLGPKVAPSQCLDSTLRVSHDPKLLRKKPTQLQQLSPSL